MECIYSTCQGKQCRKVAIAYLVDYKGNEIPVCEEHRELLKARNKHLYFRKEVK